MALSVLLSDPQNNDASVPIDSTLSLTFSKPVDEYSAINGITLYSMGAQTWTGSLLSTKDALTSDVKSGADQLNIATFSIEVSGANVKIIPSQPLLQTTQYFLQVAPGNDPTRFISAQTTDPPLYSAGTSGNITILSPYTGETTGTYTLLFTSNTTFDLMKNGIFTDSYTFTFGNSIEINKNLTISIDSGFNNGDDATINVYPAEGISGLCKITFTTSNYTTSAPRSIRIEDKLYSNQLDRLKITNTIPGHLSVNNLNINPIVIKFNRPIDPLQDFTDKIKIHKLGLDSGIVKKIIVQPKVVGNILKLYLVATEQISEVSETQIFDSLGG